MEEIYKAFRSQIYGFIFKRVRQKELAEDLLQEVFLKVHLKMDDLEDLSKAGRWVYQITRNVIIDHYRRNQPEKSMEEIQIEIQEVIEEENHQLESCIMKIFKELNKEDQAILDAVYFKKKSQKDYADEHKMNYSTIKSRLQRAEKKLKIELLLCCPVNVDSYGNIIIDKDDCDC